MAVRGKNHFHMTHCTFYIYNNFEFHLLNILNVVWHSPIINWRNSITLYHYLKIVTY